VQEDIHPEQYPTCFVDVSTGAKFISRSTRKSKKTEIINGVEHQIRVCDITSDSHPVYTGKKTLVDTAGRIQKFTEKFSRKR